MLQHLVISLYFSTYSDLQFLASRRVAAVAAAATVLPPPPPLPTSAVTATNSINSTNVNCTSGCNGNPNNGGDKCNPGGSSNVQMSLDVTSMAAAAHHRSHPHPNTQGAAAQPHDFHPAYRIPSYMEHLYSLQRTSPTASFHGMYKGVFLISKDKLNVVWNTVATLN